MEETEESSNKYPKKTKEEKKEDKQGKIIVCWKCGKEGGTLQKAAGHTKKEPKYEHKNCHK